jgi:potassium-transporting ATPase KdpC subunit
MKDLLTSLRLMVVSVMVCCVAYPAVLWTLGRLFAPARAEGSLIRNHRGQVIGSTLIAQEFTRPEYFWPRPSAVDYNAAAAGGSNLSPTSPLIRQRAQEILNRLRSGDNNEVPTDLLTASGSGLDPHISLAGATIQVSRVARARCLNAQHVEQLVRQSTDNKSLEWFGAQPIVNVLKLNVALERLGQGTHPLKKQE